MTGTSHEPSEYRCPFCAVLSDTPQDPPLPSDIFALRDLSFAFIAPGWRPRNPGNALVATREHHENLYSIPDDALVDLARLVKDVAIAMRETYGCDGVALRQHNEPAGGQDVWHIHVHVFPRYDGDDFRRSVPRRASVEERSAYASRMRAHPLFDDGIPSSQ